jgi:tetratricopeptide (TPR) repeat protein
MSPEQLRAQPLTPRSDVFSFGIVLHEMLTGEHPFIGPTSPATFNAIMADPAPTPTSGEEKIPPALLAVHEKALAKELEDRYLNATEIVRDLAEVRQAIAPVKKATHTIGIAIAMILASIIVVAGLRLLLRGPEMIATETPDLLSVLVADFDNQTGDDVYTGVLEKATSIVLEDASFVSTFRRDAALRVAEAIRPGATVLDEELARLIAHREGINIVVSGSIAKTDEGYAVSMSAVDAIDGNAVSEQHVDIRGREEVLNAVGRLAGQTREELGDTDSVAIRHAAEETFTASSLEAARKYVQAQEKLHAGKWQEAIEEFLNLAEENPEMGRAYAGAAVALANMNRREEAAEYYELAMSHIEHMSEREKFRTRGTYYLMTRNYPKASEVYEQLVEAYPYDEVARVNLVLGYFYGRQMDRALVAAQDAVENFPDSVVARANLGLIAMYAGGFETAKSQIEILFETHPSYETAYVGLALSQQALGETEDAKQTYETLGDISVFGASLAAAGLADRALASGRHNDAVEILESAIAADLENGDEAAAGRKLSALAHSELVRGRPDAAIAAAKRAVEASQQDPVLFEAARVHIGAGDQSGASAVASQLAERLAPEPRAYAKLIEGEIALAEGEASRAVTHFNDAQAILDTWLGRVDLGRAYLEGGAFLEANAEFEAALRRQGEAISVFLDDLPTFHYLPPLHYWLGRALEGLGSSASADSYSLFLEIRGNGDGDPMVADARKRAGLG